MPDPEANRGENSENTTGDSCDASPVNEVSLSRPRFLAHSTKPHMELACQDVPIVREVLEANMLPRGSALITGSGRMAKTGILRIIHACPGSLTVKGEHFSPHIEGIRLSVKNSLLLANRHIGGFPDHNPRVAIPFLGGDLFFRSINRTSGPIEKKDLAAVIIESALQARNQLQICFVAFGTTDTSIFDSALTDVCDRLRLRPSAEEVAIRNGSLLDFDLHRAPFVVNPHNMEITFGSGSSGRGGGLSGKLANASGESEAIKQGARELVAQFREYVEADLITKDS